MNGCLSALLLSVSSLVAQSATAPAAPAVVWSHDLAATLQHAKSDHVPALVFFTASWCGPCKQLKEQVCSTPAFAEAFAGHAFVMVDIDQDKASAREWQVGPIPDVRFVDANGEEIGGFVGSRSLAGVLQARDAALQSAARAEELRAAVAADPKNAAALLALAEHLLQRPNKKPGVAVLQRAIDADADDHARVAARAHWLVVGARFQVLGRASDSDIADAKQRLAALRGFTDDPDAAVYADAVAAWIGWTDTMSAWSALRQTSGNRDQPLAVPDDAPLRQTLRRLCDAAAKPSAAADAAADGLLIDGLLHYYSGDYDTGIARLTTFTRDHPAHRWHDEGLRFLGIVQRLKRQRDPQGK